MPRSIPILWAEAPAGADPKSAAAAAVDRAGTPQQYGVCEVNPLDDDLAAEHGGVEREFQIVLKHRVKPTDLFGFVVSIDGGLFHHPFEIILRKLPSAAGGGLFRTASLFPL